LFPFSRIKIKRIEKVVFFDDIVGMKTNGAVGRLTECHQQLYFAHGIQLAVIDVLYKKKEEDVPLTFWYLIAKVMKTIPEFTNKNL
jgi:hypothetical protein